MRSLLLVPLLTISCTQKSTESELAKAEQTQIARNITDSLLTQLTWMNQSGSFEVSDSTLNITASKGTDFFNNPEDSSITGTAPLLYQTMRGDFVAKALVQPDFSSQWNAAALMLHIDSLHWIKLAFENSDATGPSIVTVVTKDVSDDANGVILNDRDKIWLAIARKGNIYSMHWSTDNKTYTMARLTAMPGAEEVKIGVEVQSPVGEKATHKVLFFEVMEKTVEDMRKIE